MERLPLHLGGGGAAGLYNTQQGEQLQSEHLEHLQALLLHVQVNLQVTSCRLIVSLCGRRAVMVGVREEPSECLQYSLLGFLLRVLELHHDFALVS